ncbi:hypothetical protein ABZW18_10970 [Streptomyces sp. NPDC004647]|uniref:hypothetical protein n=1 Tax=Streptomyces sp. NPDC004647 TaxID=3154671 RepID=UPI00339EA78E
MQQSNAAHPERTAPASPIRNGLAYGFAAYGMWGLLPLYWALLEPSGAVEILARWPWSA